MALPHIFLGCLTKHVRIAIIQVRNNERKIGMTKICKFIMSTMIIFIIPLSSSALAENQSSDEYYTDNPAYGLDSNVVVSPVNPFDDKYDITTEDVYTLSDHIASGVDALPYVPSSNVSRDLSNQDFSYLLLEKINNAASWQELKAIITEHSNVLNIDYARFNQLNASQQDNVIKRLMGRKYYSIAEFSDSFNRTVKECESSTGGSSGGGSGSIVVASPSACVTPVSYENGVLTVKMTISEILTESDTLFAVIYDADEGSLLTVEEVEFSKYLAVNGSRYFTMQIPCNFEKDISLKLIGFSSVETLKPLLLD